MTDAVAAIIGRILEREGGVADIGDGMGVTRYGQTDFWLGRWRLPQPLTVEDAAANYATWLELTGLVHVCGVDDVLADAVVDFAVNAGELPAIGAMQRALGVAADGVIGPVTRAALAQCDRRRIGALVLGATIRHHGHLVTANPAKYARWARGWANRDAGKILGLL